MKSAAKYLLLWFIGFLAGRWTAGPPRIAGPTLVTHGDTWWCYSCERDLPANYPAFIDEGTEIGKEICVDCSH